MAFLNKQRRAGKTVWRVVWHDATRAAGRAGRRYVDCASGDHTAAFDAAKLSPAERATFRRGATNTALREKLLRCYEALEDRRVEERADFGATGPSFDTPLRELVLDYLKLLEYRCVIADGRDIAAPSDPGWRSKALGKPMRVSSRREAT